MRNSLGLTDKALRDLEGIGLIGQLLCRTHRLIDVHCRPCPTTAAVGTDCSIKRLLRFLRRGYWVTSDEQLLRCTSFLIGDQNWRIDLVEVSRPFPQCSINQDLRLVQGRLDSDIFWNFRQG
jgi:hypothetical protein